MRIASANNVRADTSQAASTCTTAAAVPAGPELWSVFAASSAANAFCDGVNALTTTVPPLSSRARSANGGFCGMSGWTPSMASQCDASVMSTGTLGSSALMSSVSSTTLCARRARVRMRVRWWWCVFGVFGVCGSGVYWGGGGGGQPNGDKPPHTHTHTHTHAHTHTHTCPGDSMHRMSRPCGNRTLCHSSLSCSTRRIHTGAADVGVVRASGGASNVGVSSCEKDTPPRLCSGTRGAAHTHFVGGEDG
jgi:hypothetical protein